MTQDNAADGVDEDLKEQTEENSKEPHRSTAIGLSIAIIAIIGVAGLVITGNAAGWFETCEDVEITYDDYESYTTTEPYTEQEAYEAQEPYEVTETEQVPYQVPKETQWNVIWKTLTGDRKWGAEVGKTTLQSTFSKDWGTGYVYYPYDDYIGFTAKAEINAPASGLYYLELGSDDGSELYIDGQKVIDNGGAHIYKIKSTDATLSKGKHTIELRYYDIGSVAKLRFDGDKELFSWDETEYRTEKKTVTKCCKTVTKYKDVTKYKTVTKQRPVTKTRTERQCK